MGGPRRIALIGFTGVGKTTAADHLCRAHGFEIASTGAMCRRVSGLVFGNEDKANLYSLTDALQTIDRAIFLKAALRELHGTDAIVIDALRYHQDYEYALSEGFHLVRIQAPIPLRLRWLADRGQGFDLTVDGTHPSETELSDVSVHTTILNDGSKDQLLKQIEHLVMQDGSPTS